MVRSSPCCRGIGSAVLVKHKFSYRANAVKIKFYVTWLMASTFAMEHVAGAHDGHHP